MTAPRPSQPSIHGLQKPEIAYLPTACAETCRSRRQPCFRAVLPIWDNNRGDSRGKFPNPHTFLCTTRSTHFFVMVGLDPAIHVFGGAIPGWRTCASLAGVGTEASLAYFNSIPRQARRKPSAIRGLSTQDVDGRVKPGHDEGIGGRKRMWAKGSLGTKSYTRMCGDSNVCPSNLHDCHPI